MNKIITVGRQFGSGGRELGRRLAEELGYQYYDKEIITEIANRTSMAEGYVQQIIEHTPKNLFPITIGHSLAFADNYYLKQVQSVYRAQSDIITALASKSDCVIIGRCADYILRDTNPFRLFVYATMDSRIRRCMERAGEKESYTEKDIKHKINEIDKNRAKYYEFYTGRTWGNVENYDLCINTSDKSIKELVPCIAKFIV